MDDLQEAFDEGFIAVKGYIDRELNALEARIKALESVHADGGPSLKYLGTWRDGTTYKRGECVTDDGSLWHCNEPTTSRPKDGSAAWVLCVKRGRDGKDMR